MGDVYGPSVSLSLAMLSMSCSNTHSESVSMPSEASWCWINSRLKTINFLCDVSTQRGSEREVLVGHVNRPRKLVTLRLVVDLLYRHRPLLTPASQHHTQQQWIQSPATYSWQIYDSWATGNVCHSTDNQIIVNCRFYQHDCGIIPAHCHNKWHGWVFQCCKHDDTVSQVALCRHKHTTKQGAEQVSKWRQYWRYSSRDIEDVTCSTPHI